MLLRLALPFLLALPLHPAADPAQLARIAPRMQAFVDHGPLSGAVTLVWHNGQVVHHEAAGWLDRDRKTPMRTDSIFQVMSMTKPVTAAGIMILADEGLLALTDPVEKHLPEFRGLQVREGDRLVPPHRPITFRDLLTHTSGMPEMHPPGLGTIFDVLNQPLEKVVLLCSQAPLLFQPGARWQYSNSGMATLGRAIEVVSGTSYAAFLDKRVFGPLGMKDSFFFPPANAQARIAAVYQEREGKVANMGPLIYRKGARNPFPEGGLYATAADMVAFYQMMLRGGAPVLSRAAVETMTAIHTANVQRGGTAWGLGWSIVQNASGTLTLSPRGAFGHGGAFGTYGWVDPARSLIGVLMIQYVGPEQGRIRDTFVEMVNAAIQ